MNCLKKFELEVLNYFLYNAGLKSQIFYKEGMSLLALLPPGNFSVLKANFPSHSTAKEPNISPITNFHKLFKCLLSIRVQRDAFSVVC